MNKKIAVLVGSLRKESFNRKVAKKIIELAPESLSLEIVEIGDLVHYNEDLDTDTPPQPWADFREKIKSVDGVLFVTPEYNRTLSGVLKNALDVGSRPYGKNVWSGKPGAVVSVTMSALGAFGANHTLRQSMVFLNVPMMQQPEAYIGNAQKLFTDSGDLVEETKTFLQKFINAYADWVEKITK